MRYSRHRACTMWNGSPLRLAVWAIVTAGLALTGCDSPIPGNPTNPVQPEGFVIAEVIRHHETIAGRD